MKREKEMKREEAKTENKEIKVKYRKWERRGKGRRKKQKGE